MEKAGLIILFSGFSALIGLCLGIALGAWFGRIGAFELFRSILTLPLTLFKGPGEIRSQWKRLLEARERRKVERIRFQNRLKELKEKILRQKGEIKKTKADIRRARWQFLEPE